MNTKRVIGGVAALALLAGAANYALGDEEKEETISMDKVPKAVKATLAKYATESEVKKVEKDEEDGKKVFEFEIVQGARTYEISISKKGKYLGMEQDIDFSAIAEAAQKALTAQAAGGKLSGFEKAVDAKNVVTFEADLDQGGKESEVTVDSDGKLISTEAAGEEDGD